MTGEELQRNAPLAQLVHRPEAACRTQPRSGTWCSAEQLFATVGAGSRMTGKELQRNAPLAQLVEQLTLNQWVPGSSP